jgi:hypothetical protein
MDGREGRRKENLGKKRSEAVEVLQTETQNENEL